MTIRLCNSFDLNALQEYLSPHKAECMYVCSNLVAAGIEYHEKDFQGEYFAYFTKDKNQNSKLLGFIVHYWNNNIMMHSSDFEILEQLTDYLKKHSKQRPIQGILGPNSQAELVIRRLGLSNSSFSINSNEDLYELELENLNEFKLADNLSITSTKNIDKDILIKWIRAYDIEALGKEDSQALTENVEKEIDRRLGSIGSWVLLLDKEPVSLSGYNAKTDDTVQVGPVYTPPEHRNKGYARLLISYILLQSKIQGIKKSVLFTESISGAKCYKSIGFKKIGNYRIALLK